MPYSGELARDKQEVAVAVAEEERVRGRGWDQHDQRGRGQDRHGQAGQGSQREGEGEAEMRVDNVCSTALKLQYVNDFMILCYCNGCSLKNVILVSSGDLSVLATIATQFGWSLLTSFGVISVERDFFWFSCGHLPSFPGRSTR